MPAAIRASEVRIHARNVRSVAKENRWSGSLLAASSRRVHSRIRAMASVCQRVTLDHALGDRPPVLLGGAVVDAKGPHVAEDPLDDGLGRDPPPTEDLDAAVGDAPDRLRADRLGDARLHARPLPLVEQPSGVPDLKPGGADVHLVVGQHEADPLVRSEEHTSELQSLMRISYAVFCLKKKTINQNYTETN